MTLTLGASLLALGYIFAFASLYRDTKNRRFLSWFESIGRLSLTNYLMQTILCTMIFYGYGFGLFGKLGVIAGFFLAIFIFAIQVAGSTLYLKYFRMGPFEKILRMWTYLSLKGKPKVNNIQGKEAA
ncbi:DUF418 domain-containing protein [Bacillus aquiflavi]|uniref:DUF418 domain-containing protein n=1 Tax=Bacillus aquiflavi TaxID=2672567 RepID=UPI0028682461|nr:DUF418 domain-containing protein [Bacillus aquiflavi]